MNSKRKRKARRFGILCFVGGCLSVAVSVMLTAQAHTKATIVAREVSTMPVQHTDDRRATVMGMATGYKIGDYKRYVGSLRRTGYRGHIILGLNPDTKPAILEYLKSRQVTVKLLQWVNCTYGSESLPADARCAHPYPDIKTRWSRFPLQRDWLKSCDTCTGPVLITDVRDVIFQRNPFGPDAPRVEGLQVFEEHPNQTTQHWLTEWPLRECKNVTYFKPMLCSGTTAGTREAMLRYLEAMHREMKEWMTRPECHFKIHGDDQTIHNHLFYSGQLPGATAIKHRQNGLVHTVGHQAARILRAHFEDTKLRLNATTKEEASAKWPFRGAQSVKQWLSPELKLIDEEGYMTEADGSRSFVVHQWDRFGPRFWFWISAQGIADK